MALMQVSLSQKLCTDGCWYSCNALKKSKTQEKLSPYLWWSWAIKNTLICIQPKTKHILHKYFLKLIKSLVIVTTTYKLYRWNWTTHIDIFINAGILRIELNDGLNKTLVASPAKHQHHPKANNNKLLLSKVFIYLFVPN